MKKFGLILKDKRGYSVGQIHALDKEDARRCSLSVWRVFDLNEELNEFVLALMILQEIAGAENINNPNSPVRLGVIKEETK